ncbi:ATP-binding cassette domain-containing protein, partial [uncultured Campylobacter sp.]|uniref:amino acid ABC transporter ATP-binding protein n=1 Tax=uncultured Campylobacter sp. TaxID=218934 RepID=UPI002634D82F
MIEISNLTKYYGELLVLDGISKTINKGDIVAIIGPSGGGKSTFLRCLNLLETPTSGTIKIDGKDITDKGTNINEIRRKVSMVFQHFNLFEQRTVLKNVIYPLEIAGVDMNTARARGIELLKLVGLYDKADSYPSMLSGGQKQRVAIARALS